MDSIDQTKQVFVDDSGRRGRLLAAGMRLACLLLAAYLVLLVAGFLGASWVPSVRLPIVGDIFDVGRNAPMLPPPAVAEDDDTDEQDDDVTPVESDSEASTNDGRDDLAADGAVAAGRSGNSRSAARGRGAGRGGAPKPAPQSSPNHGTASDNPNAGPKPEKTPRPQPSPNHGSNGNSENAGPKPRPSKAPDHPSNSAKGQEPEPTPTSAP